MTKEAYANLRQSAGMTHQAMADFLGVDIRTAQRYESGEIIVQGPVLKLCEILKAVGTTERLAAILSRERNRS